MCPRIIRLDFKCSSALRISSYYAGAVPVVSLLMSLKIFRVETLDREEQVEFNSHFNL
jgi:hypothetical protein